MKARLLATIGASAALTVAGMVSMNPADAEQLNVAGNASFTPDTITFSTITDIPNEINVSSNNVGIFAPFANTLATVSGTLVAPASGTVDIPDFLTLTSPTGSTLFFDLVGFGRSSIVPFTANGQSLVAVTVSGDFHDGIGTLPGSGIFTTQLVSPTTFSGALVISSVPEPSDVAGIATVGAVGGMLFFRNRKQLGVTAKS